MDKLSFTIDSVIFDNIVNRKQKAFVASIKPSEIQDYFCYTLEKKIDVKYFKCIEFKIGYAEMDFLIPKELLYNATADLTSLYDSDHMPPAEIVFEIKEQLD